MYDTVQTANDIVAKIQLSFKLAMCLIQRGFLFSDESTTMPLGALLKTQHKGIIHEKDK